ncbi:hypothetical protein BVG16_23230 [Paenibacillus selenitireducens]|uniref:AMP-dependent synthetase and ligase n=1 Tax=Paenibacillus selenitireducens TaxID=1324314 RepID=A0A1T2X449_9BACL|nr:hypothetical protein [Paenibacillus selenitireducens]OPA74674.1 hypothetical protein BVG16_23230 [Paenibacillus selenitireducens]
MHQSTQQIRHSIQQLIQQTEQASNNYQRLLQQEQQNAQQLEQLAQRERQAVQVLQSALHGHQTALQQLQSVLQSCNQIDNAGTSYMNNNSYMSPNNQNYAAHLQPNSYGYMNSTTNKI